MREANDLSNRFTYRPTVFYMRCAYCVIMRTCVVQYNTHQATLMREIEIKARDNEAQETMQLFTYFS